MRFWAKGLSRANEIAPLLIKEKSCDKKTMNKFNVVLFLPEGAGRKGEGGLRKQGCFKTSTLDKPLITVVTAVFNGEKHLEETIKSVINQTYENVEYIIIDGGSTDATLDIIKKYEGNIDYWVSEDDEGISDAFNKGVRLTLGTYINFQGDGDGYYEKNSLQNLIADVNFIDDIFISGRVQRVSAVGNEIYISKYFKKFNKKSLLFKMSIPHQGLLTHISYFKRYGLFDLNNTFCMDYEHLLRSYEKFPNVVTKDLIVARWRSDGLGTDRDLEIFKEYDKIKKENKVAIAPILMCINFWILFKFSIKEITYKYFLKKTD